MLGGAMHQYHTSPPLTRAAEPATIGRDVDVPPLATGVPGENIIKIDVHGQGKLTGDTRLVVSTFACARPPTMARIYSLPLWRRNLGAGRHRGG